MVRERTEESASLGRRLNVPLYQRVFLELRNRFLRGVYAPGADVPSERELMREFGVSRVTARRTLKALQQEGFVSITHGKKPRASALPGASHLRAHVECSADMDLEADMDLSSKLLLFEHVAASAEVAERLHLRAGETVLKTERLRFRKDDPAVYWTTYFAPPLSNQIDEDDLLGGPLLGVLVRAHVSVVSVEQQIYGRPSTARESELLAVPGSHPIICFDRDFMGPRGQRLLHARGRYRPEAFSYSLSLIQMRQLGE